MFSRQTRIAISLTLFLSLPLVPEVGLAQELRTASPESVGMSSEKLERLTLTLQHYVDDGQLAGAVAIVARRGKIAYLEAVGYRDKETDSAMAANTIFRIASQTKALVSADGSLSFCPDCAVGSAVKE